MDNNQQTRFRIPSFSVILIMIALMIVGAAVLPQLNIQYSPRSRSSQISVGFSCQGSARVVESEVTSVIEGALNTIANVSNVRASSYQNGGNVTLSFKKDTDMEAARFEVLTRLRQIRDKLPEGVSPYVSGSVSGSGSRTTIMMFTINADMPPDAIVKYANENILPPLAQIEGVEQVQPSGAMPFEWVIKFDPNSLRAAGLTPADLSEAFSNHFRNDIVGTSLTGGQLMLVRLASGSRADGLEDIPVKTSNGRLYHIGDFAKVTYEEQLPESYDRINGLNTIDIAVFGSEGINTISVADNIKNKMAELKQQFPDRFAVELVYDASEALKAEVHKILFRASMSLLILLLFVLVVSRSLRYLAVIGLTILVNLLSAVIFYWIFDIDIELYSMAGITVSLGIIIDTAIVIADHYTYYGNRRVAGSIAGALFTTIAAMLVIFFLPDSQKANLINFVWVIVINLSLSMVVAFMFVPALLDKMPLSQRGVAHSTFRRKRRIVALTAFYARFISWSRSHRWLFVTAIVLGFGLPVNLLPEKIHHLGMDTYQPESTEGGLVGLYNSTIGGKWYQRNKGWFEYPLSGAFGLFTRHTGGGASFYRDAVPEKTLTVGAEMPEGCTVQQLNDIVLQMENWLSQFDEIADFRTSLRGTSGTIDIRFKKEFANTRFPYRLKEMLWRKACGFGGATWYVSALDENDRSLSNSVYRTSWSNTMSLRGYNYDMLYRFAGELIDTLKANKRVQDAGYSAGGWGQVVNSEFCLDFDRTRIAQSGINVQRYFTFLSEQLYNRTIGSVFDGDHSTQVRLTSADRDYFDLWHIKNDMVVIDSVITRLNDVGTITKQRTGLNIDRENQVYVIKVGFEFVGSWELKTKMQEKLIKRFNKHLPMGFSAGTDSYYWSSGQKRQQAGLLLLVVAIILMICAIIFESLKKPLVIISMIPVGFVGLFIVYSVFSVRFDQGVYAAMVMLCGIVVNASIYLFSEYGTICQLSGRGGLRSYLKAFNRKIIPTLLTIVSTVLGLIPFLFDGREEVFWFAFAICIMGGMVFSVLALIVFMPVFAPIDDCKEKE